MQKQIHDLLEKEVSRQEFLAMVGFGLASVFGLSSLLRLLGQGSSKTSRAEAGYGSRSYGG